MNILDVLHQRLDELEELRKENAKLKRRIKSLEEALEPLRHSQDEN